MTLSFFDRVAGAPISWGVCEVPGWGLELPVERVLGEMRELGLTATELGSDGYLPTEPEALRAVCAEHDLEMIGGFVPLVLHDPDQRDASLAAAERAAALMGGAGGSLFITSMVTTFDWAPRIEIDAEAWDHAASMLAQVEEVVAAHGMRQAIHPHLGTMIERPEDVKNVLDRSEVGWTFDMGHLMIGGYDPVEFLADARDRIVHVHLKDVHLDRAAPVFAGERSIMEGVQNGMFCPMGDGDVPVAEVVTELERTGYDGWYVLEQDAAITGAEPAPGEGPKLDVLRSIEYLRAINAQFTSALEAS
ncbi:MAG: TIM barrel protein [Actinomycetota bacterium]